MTERQRVRIGDVVAIPVDDEDVAIAHVIARPSPRFVGLAIHEGLYSLGSVPDLHTVVARPRCLMVSTFDISIVNGRWPVLGSLPVDPETPLPAFVVETSHGWRVEDYLGRRHRPADERLRKQLPLRSTVSDAGVEELVAAVHGRRAWLPRYDEHRPPRPEVTSQALFERSRSATTGRRLLPRVGAGLIARIGRSRSLRGASDALDAATLRGLRQAGADAAEPRETVCYLAFTTERGATEAATALMREGRRIEAGRGADGTAWTLMVIERMKVDETSVTANREEMEAVACLLGGSFDGWEAAI